MSTAEKHLTRIQEKLQHLLKQHAALQKENVQLKKQLEGLNGKTSDQDKKIESLKQQASVLKMNAGELQAGDKKEIEKKINGYLKEIDRCIALLGQ